MPDLRKQLVPRHIGSTLSEFMLEMCPATQACRWRRHWPMDSSIKLCPLVYQMCFEFLEVSYPSPIAHSRCCSLPG